MPTSARKPLWRQPGFLGYLALHLACLAAFWTGVTWAAVAVAVALYLARMFAITGFYHRYFSHKTFRTSRPVQFLFALLGATSGQRGPLWWASHHRRHHARSDQEDDLHSPRQHGIWHSHVGWIWLPEAARTEPRWIKDLWRVPELRWLDRWHAVAPVGLGLGVFLLGWLLERVAPGLGTDRWQLVVVGFCWSTVALYHGTYTINSLSHRFGRRRFATRDDSRNNWLLAILTLGEGWHNNHHMFPGTVRQGFRWYEYDPTWYVLWLMERVRLVRDLRGLPPRARAMLAGQPDPRTGGRGPSGQTG